jgi:F-type H+-transporting ATPase subunit b
VARLTDILVIAQAEGGGEEGGGGNFLVSPELGLMIWALLAFGITLFLLNKLAFPRIAEALDRRRKAIEESIEAANRAKQEADELLEEYRARLREAREQAEDIVVRARRAAEIEHETRRALDELRREVADLTVMATEKITRKSLTEEDHRRLIEEALAEVDFEELAPSKGNGR